MFHVKLGNKMLKARIALDGTHVTRLPAISDHSYLLPDTSERASHNPSPHAGCTRFTYPGGMEG